MNNFNINNKEYLLSIKPSFKTIPIIANISGMPIPPRTSYVAVILQTFCGFVIKEELKIWKLERVGKR